jgi:hypothetical protein
MILLVEIVVLTVCSISNGKAEKLSRFAITNIP